MTEDPDPDAPFCAATDARSCVFAKALLARAASCQLSQRRLVGEREVLQCATPTARINCGTLAGLLHERARFALRLPPAGRPMMHVQALRLQCGGLSALGRQFDAAAPDVHAMVGAALERHGSLAELPWGLIVAELAAWQPRRRARRDP